MLVPRRCLLSGHMPVHLAERHDYPWREVVLSFLPAVDEFLILCPKESPDGTSEAVAAFAREHPQVRVLWQDWWNPARKENCLADATTTLIEQCQGVYHVAVQADEVLHENQVETLRGIAENGSWVMAEFERLNFFGSFDIVNVNRNRWPCSVVRMGRRDHFPNLRGHGDATHIGYVKDYDANLHTRIDARGLVQLWHYAYSRYPGAYLERQRAMAALYQYDEDPRLVRCREAGRMDWFSVVPKSEFVPIPGPHPKIIQTWIEARREAVESGVL